MAHGSYHAGADRLANVIDLGAYRAGFSHSPDDTPPSAPVAARIAQLRQLPMGERLTALRTMVLDAARVAA